MLFRLVESITPLFRIKIRAPEELRGGYRKRVRTLCLGTLRGGDTFSVICPPSNYTIHSNQITFKDKEGAERFAERAINKFSDYGTDYYISRVRREVGPLTRVRTEFGEAYVSSEYINHLQTSFKMKDYSAAILDAQPSNNFPKFITYEGEEYTKGEELTGGAWSYVRWDYNNNARYLTVHPDGTIERN